MIISAISGLTMILLFGVVAFDLAFKESFRKITMSGNASNASYLYRVKIIVFRASVCGIIYTIGAAQLLGLSIFSVTFFSGIVGSIAMTLMALTLNNPESSEHTIFSEIFFFSLLILPIDIIIFFYNTNLIFSIILGILFLLNASLEIKMLFDHILLKKKLIKRSIVNNGIAEVLIMTPSAISVVVISILIIEKIV